MKIFLGIDGTNNSDETRESEKCYIPSAISDASNTSGTRNRHVKRIMRFGFAKQKYLIGTFNSMTGMSSMLRIVEAARWLKSQHRNFPSAKIYLSGFSRGGAAILVVGHLLEDEGIPVEAMFLFDAVDRSFVMDPRHTSWPSANVKTVFHAMRDPSTGSRRTFGNCGTVNRHGNMPANQVQKFRTTHGGIGGWPYKDSSPAEGKMMVPGMLLWNAYAAHQNANAGKIHEDYEPLATNLTAKEELAGMEAAWKWMEGNVTKSI